MELVFGVEINDEVLGRVKRRPRALLRSSLDLANMTYIDILDRVKKGRKTGED